ncbi:MFS transporter [Stachybotrys elegans]|uniref:MFS transporter n=1 Tax=Stachybotrys elegans TaxID=80388 RepID=A0A8K0SWQ8_9HYPO|nr:MFS transporter [Stachybotrys elegans]
MKVEEATDVSVGEMLDLDEGEQFLRTHNVSSSDLQELIQDEAAVKKLVRKVDLKILPLLAGTFMMQYIDKQALSYAAVFDLFTDTGISQYQYSWFASLFYFAYLVAEYPWSTLAQRTRMAKVVAGCVIAWGGILMVTAACENFSGLAACRFFLGFFEAPITPCFMMIVGMWYTRDEQPFRAGVFYSCNGVGSMLGGILTYAIGQIDSFPVWKAIFLLCGGITVLWGAVLLVFLPDNIIQAKNFSVQEKATLIGRAKLGRTGILSHQIKPYQIKEALLDPQIWLLTLFMLLNETINGGIANFGKLIIKGLVKDPLLTTALGIPQGAFQVVFILSGTFFASYFRNARTYVMMAYLLPTIVGVSILWKLDREQYRVGVLIGYYLCGAFVSALVVALQMPGANLGGYTKRMTGTAMVFAAYCVGNIIGPHAFLQEEAPIYQTGVMVVLICSVSQMVVAFCLRMLLIRRNKKRDEQAALDPSSNTAIAAEVSTDQTDFENPHFRYVL